MRRLVLFTVTSVVTLEALACGPGIESSLISTPVPAEVGYDGGYVPLADGGPSRSLDFARGNEQKLALENGWRYCQHIEDHSSRTASQWAWIGVPSIALGAGAALAGGGLAIRDTVSDDKSSSDRRVDVLLDGAILAGGALFVALGAYAFSRSSAAARATRAANLGGALPYNANDPLGNEAFSQCARAKADWAASREESNEATQAAVDGYRKGFLDGKASADGGAGDASSSSDADAPPPAKCQDGGAADGGC